MATVSHTRMADMTEEDLRLMEADAEMDEAPIVEEVFSRPRYAADELPAAP